MKIDIYRIKMYVYTIQSLWDGQTDGYGSERRALLAGICLPLLVAYMEMNSLRPFHGIFNGYNNMLQVRMRQPTDCPPARTSQEKQRQRLLSSLFICWSLPDADRQEQPLGTGLAWPWPLATPGRCKRRCGTRSCCQGGGCCCVLLGRCCCCCRRQKGVERPGKRRPERPLVVCCKISRTPFAHTISHVLTTSSRKTDKFLCPKVQCAKIDTKWLQTKIIVKRI